MRLESERVERERPGRERMEQEQLEREKRECQDHWSRREEWERLQRLDLVRGR